VLGAVEIVDDTTVRLLEMGMTEGTPFALTRRAPFGDPLEIELRGTRLVLRAASADLFAVHDVVLP
jgi:ferrous iron transport protein A